VVAGSFCIDFHSDNITHSVLNMKCNESEVKDQVDGAPSC
jgi:hypothetical protein